MKLIEDAGDLQGLGPGEALGDGETLGDGEAKCLGPGVDSCLDTPGEGIGGIDGAGEPPFDLTART